MITAFLSLITIVVVVFLIMYRDRINWWDIGSIIIALIDGIVSAAIGSSSSKKSDRYKGDGGSSGGGGDSGRF